MLNGPRHGGHHHHGGGGHRRRSGAVFINSGDFGYRSDYGYPYFYQAPVIADDMSIVREGNFYHVMKASQNTPIASFASFAAAKDYIARAKAGMQGADDGLAGTGQIALLAAGIALFAGAVFMAFKKPRYA